MSETEDNLGNTGTVETEENSPTYLKFREMIDSGEGEINAEMLQKNYENREISVEELATLAIYLLKKTELLVEEAGIDELTKLNNLKGFNEKSDKIVEELRFTHEDRREIPLKSVMLIFLDMNDLNTLNNTYGHKNGDKALIALGNRLKESVKEKDIVARIHGDEFLILLPIDSDEENIHEKIFTRLKTSISNITIDFINKNDKPIKNYPILAAAGYSVLDKSDHEKTVEELRDEADAAMYKNKAEMKEPVK